MKAANATLIALLNAAQQFVSADMYTFTLQDGTVVRYTSADVNLTVGGNAFLGGPNAPLVTRDRIAVELGTSVSEMDVTVDANSGDLLAGQAWLAAAVAGKLDYAKLLVQQFISSSWTDATPGLLYLFEGRVADVEVDRLTAKLKVRSPMELLDLNMPRNLYTPGCYHQLYDSGCTLNRATFTSTNAVAASPAPTRSVFASTMTQADGYFNQGTLTFTSGVLNGLKRTVQTYLNNSNAGKFTLTLPLPQAPSAADTFSVVPGCDKQQTTCNTKFSNLVNFAGHPYIPTPETTL